MSLLIARVQGNIFCGSFLEPLLISACNVALHNFLAVNYRQ